jgi:hypothetical protein
MLVCPFCCRFLWNALYAGLFVKPAAALGDSTASVAAVALGAPEETTTAISCRSP